MRLLTVVCDLLPGGTQRVARNFAIGYERHGLESAVLGYWGGGVLEHSLPGNVQVFRGGRDAQGIDRALREAIAWQPDVVHFHRTGPHEELTGGLLRALRESSRRGTAAPVGVMETNVFARVDYSSDREYIDVHLQLSRWCLWRWLRWSKFLSPRPLAVVVPNLVMHQEFTPLPTDARDEFRRQHDIPQDAIVFGRTGSPVEPKWSPLAFQAFSIFAQQEPRAWLLLVGLPGELRPALRSLPPELQRRVVDIEFLTDDYALRSAYAAMDVFLHASRIGETFGMVLAEALLSGVPAITLSTPARDNSQLEVVGHEVGGLVVADAAGMVQAMRRMQDPILRHRYAVQGAASIVERFGPEVVLPRAIAIAELCAAGLSRQELHRRLLALPDVCTEVSSGEIVAHMRRCIGRYGLKTLASMHLVANPLIYRAYRSVMARL